MPNFATQDQCEQFKTLIRKHVAEVLPKEEWIWLRDRATDQLAGVVPYPEVDDTENAEQLIDANICEDSGQSTDEIIRVLGVKATEIGRIDGCQVRYLERTGIYMWDIKAQPGSTVSTTLSFWISFPAYPPGW